MSDAMRAFGTVSGALAKDDAIWVGMGLTSREQDEVKPRMKLFQRPEGIVYEEAK